MNTVQKVTTGAAALVIAGLVALIAVPTVVGAGSPAAAGPVATTGAVEPTAVPESSAPAQEAAAPGQAASWGSDEQIAVQADWCKQIDAAWDAYFGHNDSAAAVTILQAAAATQPASFGPFDVDGGKVFHTRAIDRDVRFIDGGPDSQYIEYTTNGCWDWAEALGVDLGDKAVDPIRLP